MVPQWDLLDLIADAGKAEPTFSVRMRHDVTGLLREGGRVTGVRYTSPDGAGETASRPRRGMRRPASVAPRRADCPSANTRCRSTCGGSGCRAMRRRQYSLIPRDQTGRALIMIPREGYFQIAYLIPKGG